MHMLYTFIMMQCKNVTKNGEDIILEVLTVPIETVNTPRMGSVQANVQWVCKWVESTITRAVANANNFSYSTDPRALL